jgi:hypothetical protein
VLAALAFDLTRALTSAFHAKASTATIRAQLIAVPAPLAGTFRTLILHLPTDWPGSRGLDPAVHRHRCTAHRRLTRTTSPPGPTGDHSGQAGKTGSQAPAKAPTRSDVIDRPGAGAAHPG